MTTGTTMSWNFIYVFIEGAVLRGFCSPLVKTLLKL